jgi:hypothetical protein
MLGELIKKVTIGAPLLDGGRNRVLIRWLGCHASEPFSL